jgi:D-glycero-D-manno-heptose 1,7-bisphosphate phosphatase
MKVVFLDRDGVINEDHGYVYKIDDFKFKSGIFSLLKDLQSKGYKFYVITNQSGIGRGYYSYNDFFDLNDYMFSVFKENKINLLGISYCPHKPEDNCICRKPKPKMLIDVVSEFGIDKNMSWFIGDNDTDIQFAKNAGILNTIKIGKKTNNNIELYNVKNLIEIIKII